MSGAPDDGPDDGKRSELGAGGTLSARSSNSAFELDFRKADTQNGTLGPLLSLPWNVVANQPELRIAA